MEIKKGFVNEIENCKWLNNCGTHENYSFEVEFIKSQSKLKKCINSIKWENTCLEAGGDFTAFLHLNHKEDYNKYWNLMIDKIKEDYIVDIEKKLNQILSNDPNKNDIIVDMKSNLLILFMANFINDDKGRSNKWKKKDR